MNEDACLLEVARTPLGEVALAVMCDGVGGYASGEVASSTVAHQFLMWFENELPLLVKGMSDRGAFDFDAVQVIWESMLQEANGVIRSYGASKGHRLGTTFTGLIACGGAYLVGHVGDCRALLLGKDYVRQITEDQTLANKQLAAGEPVDAAANHVILQAVGTQRLLKPAFYRGTYNEGDLFVLCCDGVWKRPGNDGIASMFADADRTSETSLTEACQAIIEHALRLGEVDNLTVACLSGVASAHTVASVSPVFTGDDSSTEVFAGDDTEAAMAGFMVHDRIAEGDDTSTLVFEEDDVVDGDDSATFVFEEPGGNDSPTIILEEGDA